MNSQHLVLIQVTIFRVFRRVSVLLYLWILFAPLLQAAEPAFIRESIRARGMGNAFTAAANDEMLLFYNPAALRSVYYNMYEVVGFNTTTNENTINLGKSRGLEALRNLLQNRTTVLSGHSGVGKSSLIKALFPDWEIRIGRISNKSGKGRHTTRMAEMFRIPIGGFIVDTPGIRELEPLVTPNELDSHYVEFVPYLGQCKFKGCTHIHEPHCLIKDAVASKKITEQRYKSYCTLFESL